MISYAQRMEDVTLARVFDDRPTGFYVDVGASDPVVRSVTKHFYELGWHGVNIEPVARFHRALVQDRPRDVNLCIALGTAAGTLEFFEFDTEGISTLSREHAEHFIRQNHRCTPHTVDVVPLREVCAQFCREPIDFLKIDVEGWERQVLEGGDWTRFRPRVLLVEATKPNSSEPAWDTWEPFLLSRGYVFAYFDGLNRFYVANEESPLLGRFPSKLEQMREAVVRRTFASLASVKRLLRPRNGP